MTDKALYSEEFYSDVWRPYLEYSKFFKANHPENFESFSTLSNHICDYVSFFQEEPIRFESDLENLDWEKRINEYYENVPINSRYIGADRMYIPRVGDNRFWVDYCLSWIMSTRYGKPRAYLDVGCGTGNFLAHIHTRNPNKESRLFGLERSKAGVECAHLAFSLLDGHPDAPVRKVIEGDIQQFPKEAFDCAGLDVVIFTVSVINKIEKLDADFFSNAIASLKNPGRVEFIHIESTGWQLYFDERLREFYSRLPGKLHRYDATNGTQISKQRQKNESMNSNTNFMEVIARAHSAGDIRIRNVFLNGLTHTPIDPYSVIVLDAP